MKNWKHLTYEQRKVIVNGITHKYTAKEISEALGFDPTSISKEVKRNRFILWENLILIVIKIFF